MEVSKENYQRLSVSLVSIPALPQLATQERSGDLQTFEEPTLSPL